MKLTVASSPHIRGNFRTNRIMMDVCLALVPALLAGIWKFGFRVIPVTTICIGAAIVTEWLYCLLTKSRNTTLDGSAIVTGMLLAMTLPHTVPYWQCALGSVFAILFVKCLCGGLGQNIFNPALAARAFLLLIYPLGVTRYLTVDGVSAATPLHHMVMPALPEESLLDMFLGNCPGSIGEISAAALLIGFAYLLWRNVISARIPVAYLGTVAVLTLVFHKTDAPVTWMLYSLLSGGVMLGAIFMATDYATSPATPVGQVVYGIGCGVLTVVFRYYGLFPEGVTYAILIMNAFVWFIDYMTPIRRFGVQKGGTAK